MKLGVILELEQKVVERDKVTEVTEGELTEGTQGRVSGSECLV